MVELIPAVIGIVIIDLALAGDNAVVIGMAAYRLPRHQRNIALALGAVGAMALGISLTAVAALVLGLPLLQFIGGLILVWIAYKLLRPVEAVQAAADSHAVEAASSLWEAVQTIIIADIVMSLDNVLAIVGASKGNILVPIFGLVVGIAILMAGGRLVASILDRFPGFVYLGSGILAWVAGGHAGPRQLCPPVLGAVSAGGRLSGAGGVYPGGAGGRPLLPPAGRPQVAAGPPSPLALTDVRPAARP